MDSNDDKIQLMAYRPSTYTSGSIDLDRNFGSFNLKAVERRIQGADNANIFQGLLQRQEQEQERFNAIKRQAEEKKMNEQKKPTRRVVRVFIVDPDENLPLESAVLLKGDEQLTDLTDDELFLEIGIKPMLAEHNAARVLLKDKKASAKAGKDVFLEPIKIRDLKMVVSTLAEF